MSNIYDAQFRERALHHCLFCDELSCEIIHRLVEYLDRALATIGQASTTVSTYVDESAKKTP